MDGACHFCLVAEQERVEASQLSGCLVEASTLENEPQRPKGRRWEDQQLGRDDERSYSVHQLHQLHRPTRPYPDVCA